MAELDPTAGLTDFDAVSGLRAGWSQMLSDLIDSMNYGPLDPGAGPTVIDELKIWGRSDADIRFYNPLSMPIPEGSTSSNVPWRALPTSFDEVIPDKTKRYTYIDNPHLDAELKMMSRVQDEYNEWVVFRDQNSNKITQVVFTSEPIAYYDFLANPPSGVDVQASRRVLVNLYSLACGGQQVPLGDLLQADGTYDPYNKWNGRFAVHMQQKNNSLGAEVNIAARSAILRMDITTGALKTDAQELIACGKYGDGERQSDPAIGAAVNGAVRQNRFITLQNPIGLYMTGLDTTGWTTPDGTDPQTFWSVIRGTATGDSGTSRIVRAKFEVPSGHGYTVSDVQIGGIAINYGSQIAEHIGMRLGVTVSPPSSLPPPRAIGCLGQKPATDNTTSARARSRMVRSV